MSLRDSAEKVVRCLREAGFEACFVGGCVRDMLLGIEPHDYDVATSALVDDIRTLFPVVLEVGAQFGVARVRVDEDWFEVATFRSDVGYADGRRPDKVLFTDAKGDVLRRDFTINGLLYDPVAHRVIDYVGGQEDIRNKVIRCVGDPAVRFGEDKLRLLRAVRFAARFAFEIEPATFRAVRDNAESIKVVSAERIGSEVLNMLTGPQPDRALLLLRDTDLLRHVLPEVHAMIGVPQPEEFHPEGDVFEHTVLILGLMRDPGPELAVAALLHDVGKPPTYSETDRIRFNEHARVGAEMSSKICRRLRYSSSVAETVSTLIATHMTFMDVRNMRESRLRRFIREPYFSDALEMHRLDCSASHRNLENWEFCKAKLEALEPEQVRPARLLTGHDLIEMGYAPGPEFARILESVEDAQLEGAIHTREEAIEFVNRNFPGK